MSNNYPCCNDCGSTEAIWRITFGCYLCAECYAYAVEEEDMLRKAKKMTKIINPDYAGEMSVQEAVIFAVTPEGYMYSGELDRLKQTNENLTKLVARIVEVMCHNAIDVEKILGHGFEVAND